MNYLTAYPLTNCPFTLLCPSGTEKGDVRGQGGPDTQEAQCKQQAPTPQPDQALCVRLETNVSSRWDYKWKTKLSTDSLN